VKFPKSFPKPLTNPNMDKQDKALLLILNTMPTVLYNVVTGYFPLCFECRVNTAEEFEPRLPKDCDRPDSDEVKPLCNACYLNGCGCCEKCDVCPTPIHWGNVKAVQVKYPFRFTVHSGVYWARPNRLFCSYDCASSFCKVTQTPDVGYVAAICRECRAIQTSDNVTIWGVRPNGIEALEWHYLCTKCITRRGEPHPYTGWRAVKRVRFV
jgi:hypothetical protein